MSCLAWPPTRHRVIVIVGEEPFSIASRDAVSDQQHELDSARYPAAVLVRQSSVSVMVDMKTPGWKEEPDNKARRVRGVVVGDRAHHPRRGTGTLTMPGAVIGPTATTRSGSGTVGEEEEPSHCWLSARRGAGQQPAPGASR